MLRRLSLAAAAGFVMLACAAPASAQPTPSPNDPSSGQLVAEPQKWDGQTITYTGEAVTEAMERGDFAWIHVNDDAYYLKNVEEGAALGGNNSGHAVWLPTELADKIGHFGDYTHEGDVVTVVGVFNAACSQHGGDMDIHATSLEVRVPGHVVHEPVKLVKLVVAVGLIGLAGLLWMAHRRAQHLDMFGPLSRQRG